VGNQIQLPPRLADVEQSVAELVPRRLAATLLTPPAEQVWRDFSPDHLQTLPDALDGIARLPWKTGDRDASVRPDGAETAVRLVTVAADVVDDGVGGHVLAVVVREEHTFREGARAVACHVESYRWRVRAGDTVFITITANSRASDGEKCRAMLKIRARMR